MAITNGYATLAQLKDALNITDSIEDLKLEIAINSASRDIDAHCERMFYTTSATRVFVPRSSEVCEIDDLITLTTLKTSTNVDQTYDTTWTSSDYQLEPLNGIAGGLVSPYTQIRATGTKSFPTNGEEATVQIVGTFGYGNTVPAQVTQACILLSSRYYKRNDSPVGVLGFGDFGAVRVSRFDPDVESLLAPFKKLRFA